MTEPDPDRLASIVARFAGRRLCVTGDLVADLYLRGVPVRVSREAPVLILRYEGEELIPGGAANTANNVLALGAEVFPVGVVGDDEPGRAVLRYFRERRVDVSGIVVARDHPTITKTRIMAGAPTRHPHQVVRIDREPGTELPHWATEQVAGRLRAVAGRAEGFVFSDYGYGAATPELAATVAGLRVADSRARIARFAGFTALTPNEEEAAEVAGAPVFTEEETRRAGRALLEASGAENAIITRGNKGMAVFSRAGRERFLAASGAEEVTDVTGAGDTVTGVLALALAAGATAEEAAILANHAGGIVVAKPGAATLSRDELLARLR
ncbi:MAG: PfkB family carbohydrate kinase [Planctomycetes bacterium]|jgi:rfaE bifunctional protein kinase chain/domain|nr:PfkB family carbohydrate kinase [Planctomycetota bacterium]